MHIKTISVIPKIINKTLQQSTEYKNNNKYSQNPKIHEKRECRGHLNHKLFLENITYDPLTVFS